MIAALKFLVPFLAVYGVGAWWWCIDGGIGRWCIDGGVWIIVVVYGGDVLMVVVYDGGVLIVMVYDCGVWWWRIHCGV